MTNEEMRLLIAEKCGWKHTHTEVSPLGIPPEFANKTRAAMYERILPNYPSDLNAMLAALIQHFEFQIWSHDEGFGVRLYHLPFGSEEVQSFPDQFGPELCPLLCESFCRVFWPERWKEGDVQ